MFQAISIPRGDQHAVLQTNIPSKFISKTPVEFEHVKRRTFTSSQQSSDYPFIAYNMGDNRIFLQNIQQATPQVFVLEMEPDEQFLGFVEFRNYTDIGFYPKDIRIECCSKFLFMTKRKNLASKDIQGNRLNLLLADPFYAEFQGAWFKSSTFFDNAVWDNSDFIIR